MKKGSQTKRASSASSSSSSSSSTRSSSKSTLQETLPYEDDERGYEKTPRSSLTKADNSKTEGGSSASASGIKSKQARRVSFGGEEVALNGEYL